MTWYHTYLIFKWASGCCQNGFFGWSCMSPLVCIMILRTSCSTFSLPAFGLHDLYLHICTCLHSVTLSHPAVHCTGLAQSILTLLWTEACVHCRSMPVSRCCREQLQVRSSIVSAEQRSGHLTCCTKSHDQKHAHCDIVLVLT